MVELIVAAGITMAAYFMFRGPKGGMNQAHKPKPTMDSISGSGVPAQSILTTLGASEYHGAIVNADRTHWSDNFRGSWYTGDAYDFTDY